MTDDPLGGARVQQRRVRPARDPRLLPHVRAGRPRLSQARDARRRHRSDRRASSRRRCPGRRVDRARRSGCVPDRSAAARLTLSRCRQKISISHRCSATTPSSSAVARKWSIAAGRSAIATRSCRSTTSVQVGCRTRWQLCMTRGSRCAARSARDPDGRAGSVAAGAVVQRGAGTLRAHPIAPDQRRRLRRCARKEGIASKQLGT